MLSHRLDFRSPRHRLLKASGLLLAILLGPSELAAQSQADQAVGSEVVVNSYTTGDQDNASVARAPNGNYLLVWESRFQDGDLEGLFGQVLDPVGAAISGEFQVNTYATGDQTQADVGIDSQGNFVVVWTDFGGQDGELGGIFGQRIADTGATISGEFAVNSYTSSGQSRPSVASTGDGFVVVWSNLSNGQINARLFDAGGSPVGGDEVVQSGLLLDHPDVASDDDGNFVVVWTSRNQEGGNDEGLFARRFSSTGVALNDEFPVNSWTTGDQDFPTIAVGANGDFLISWQSSDQDGSGYPGIYAQKFAADGTPEGTETQVPTSTAFPQEFPRVAADANDNFIVVWQSFEQDGFADGIYGRRIGSAGAPIATEFRVNVTTFDYQSTPSVAADGNGGFIVAWDSRYQEPDFDFSKAAIAQRFQTNGVGDRVFEDTDLDGIQDSGEPGVANVPVHLYDDAANLLRSTTTDENGDYGFQTVPSGDLFVEFELPLAWSFAVRDAGADDTLDSDADRLTGRTDTFTISPGEVVDRWDAGLARGVGDLVWLDDGDGVQESGEPGVAGVLVHLNDKFGLPVATTTTDENGRYALDTSGGIASVEVVAPAGFAFTLQDAGDSDSLDSDVSPETGRTPDFLLDLGELQPFWDAGLVELSQVSDFIWHDLDGDGQQGDLEPGIEGVTVHLLDDGDLPLQSTVTDVNGRYYFTNVPDGMVRVTVDIPTGYLVTLQDQGDDESDSDLDATGRSGLITIAQEIERSVDGGFALVPPMFTDGFESGDTQSWSSTTP